MGDLAQIKRSHEGRNKFNERLFVSFLGAVPSDYSVGLASKRCGNYKYYSLRMYVLRKGLYLQSYSGDGI